MITQSEEKNYNVTKPNSQRALDEAARDDLDVVFPADDELQIDIDSDEAFAVYEEHFDIVQNHIGVLNVTINPSRSGLPKRHITLKLKTNVSMIERLALQAMLGSDRLREILGYVQYKNNDPHPVLFLEKKPPKQLEGSTQSDLLLTEGEIGPLGGLLTEALQ